MIFRYNLSRCAVNQEVKDEKNSVADFDVSFGLSAVCGHGGSGRHWFHGHWR
jgi:hypothetical protein